MNKAKRNYAEKIKRREVVFYIKDIDLYEETKTYNFQNYVKRCLAHKELIDLILKLVEKEN